MSTKTRFEKKKQAKGTTEMASCFITLALFYQTLVSQNPLKAYRHEFQWLHCVVGKRS